MADDQVPKTEPSVAGIIETAAQAVTILVAVSLLAGITFNIAFFLSTKREWLFHVSIADNISAALYALPLASFVFFMMAGTLGLMLLGKQSSAILPTNRREYLRFLAFAFPAVIVIYCGILVWTSGLRTALVVAAVMAILAALLFSAIYVHKHEWPIGIKLAVLGGVSVVAMVTAAAATGVGSSYEKRPKVEVEVGATKETRGILVGSVVRDLEGGLILSQPGKWVWIPKDQIRRISEFEETQP
jgi:hypothetical protein